MILQERYDIIREGGKIGELEALDTVSITMQASAKVKTDLSGTFAPNPQFDPPRDYIRPMIAQDGAWQSLGLFMPTQILHSYEDGVGNLQLSGMDLGHLVDRRHTESRLFFAQGLAYTDVVQQLLQDCGIRLVRCADSPLRLRTAREDWDIGTPYIDIINQLLSEINYTGLWFDVDGYAQVGPQSREPQRAYEAGELSIILPEYTLETDVGGAYNVFIAYVASDELENPMWAMAENNDPSSAISTANIGRNPLVEQLSDIPDQETLEAYVQKKRDASLSGTQRVSFETAVRPHGVGDTVFLNHHQAHGIYRETDYSITLGEGASMTHTAERMVLL